MLLFESAPTYFIEPGKRVVLPFLCCPPPVVEHRSIFSRWVGERHPLPRPDFLGPQFCFDCSITLSCITWQQWRCIPVVEKSTGWWEARSSPGQTQRDFRLRVGSATTMFRMGKSEFKLYFRFCTSQTAMLPTSKGRIHSTDGFEQNRLESKLCKRPLGQGHNP